MAESVRKETLMKKVMFKRQFQLLLTSLMVGVVLRCLLRLIAMLHIKDPELFLPPTPFGIGLVGSLYQTLKEAGLLAVAPYVIMVLHFLLSVGYASKGDGSNTEDRRSFSVSLYSMMAMVILIAGALCLLATATLPILSPLR
jgi:hypothetical protein